MAHFEIRCLFIPFPTLTPPSLDPGLTSNIPNEKVSLFCAISSEKLCGIWLTTGQCLNSGTWATTILSTMTRILSLRTAWSFADGRITLTFMSSHCTVGFSTVSLRTRSSTANEDVIVLTSFFCENPWCRGTTVNPTLS